MANLHSWVGLLVGWLLFSIFLLGSISYYREDITAWMQPDYQHINVDPSQTVSSALVYLQQNAPTAKYWYIQPASQNTPINTIYWQQTDGTFNSKQLHPNTGKELNLLPTQGGDFLYYLHFQLFGIPVLIGRLIVSALAIIMLVALISGIITHKKIFIDFFTLRAFKGQRSWLDFHNVVSVIALPFFLTITFTGLAILFYVYFPSNIQKYYPNNIYDIFDELRNKPALVQKPIQPQKMLTAQAIQQHITQQWQHAELDSLEIKAPNTNNAIVTVKQKLDHSITLAPAQLTFSAVTGQALTDLQNPSAVTTLYNSMYGLHMAPFAQPIIRLGLFFSGILGCLMIASGLLLWSLKRQIQKSTYSLGYYMVDRLNVSTFVGLPIAILGYFYTNRLFTVFYPHLPNYEIHVFFIIWLSCLFGSLVVKKENLWLVFLSIFFSFALLLPLVSGYVIHRIGLFELFVWCFAGFSWFMLKNIQPIQKNAYQKLTRRKKHAHS